MQKKTAEYCRKTKDQLKTKKAISPVKQDITFSGKNMQAVKVRAISKCSVAVIESERGEILEMLEHIAVHVACRSPLA